MTRDKNKTPSTTYPVSADQVEADQIAAIAEDARRTAREEAKNARVAARPTDRPVDFYALTARLINPETSKKAIAAAHVEALRIDAILNEARINVLHVDANREESEREASAEYVRRLQAMKDATEREQSDMDE